MCECLIGTKCDLEKRRVISFEEGKKYAEKNGMKFFEASSKKNINISEPFIEMTKNIIKQQKYLDILEHCPKNIKFLNY